jgi:uncharacterized protein YqeY
MAKRTKIAPQPVEDVAEVIKRRLRSDLKSAMQARAKLETSVLRAIIAALDDAQAVPVSDKHVRYVVHEFGDPAAEAPRLRLSVPDVQKLLEREIKDRREAADKLEQLGKVDRATELREEASIVTRYLIR